MIDNRNMILAIVISLAILLGFEFFVNAPQRERLAQQQAEQQSLTIDPETGAPQPATGEIPAPPGAAPVGAPDVAAIVTREQALAESPRLAIETSVVSGSISLKGARLDDLTLHGYRETIEPDSPEIILLSPVGTERPYYVSFGWSAGDRAIELPTGDTLWQAEGDTLTPDTPVTLSWTSSQGVRFEQVFALDETYMFTVTQRVVNESDAAVALSTYSLISRTGHPEILGFYILHEGLTAVVDGSLKEVDYSDLEEDGVMQFNTTGGWIGITDKYWQAVLVPDQQLPVSARMVYTADQGPGKYQTDLLYDSVSVPAGGSSETTSRVFAGAKEVILLDAYKDNLGIVNFDLAVDFGWFYFLTKPFFYALHYFAGVLGNFGLAILLLTVIVKVLFFPLANKSYRAMAKMKKLQPEMTVLKERFGDDRQRLNQEMMALYKKEGANPAAGCLPMFIQIPVFFALYKVLFVTIEMRHTPFYGWIQDLSAPDPTSVLNLFGLLPYDVTGLGVLDVISIGVWPIVMGLTMMLQHRLNPQPADPVQAKIFMWMPIIFTFLLAKFPAGLVIYWTWNNLLSILQQMVIMKRAGVAIGGGRVAQTKPAAAASANPGKTNAEAPPDSDAGEADDDTEADGEGETEFEGDETTQAKAHVARAKEGSRARRKSRRNRKRSSR